MQESGIYDRHNITQEALAGLDGNGTYVSIERAGNEIIIRQDFIGSYGLYVYRDGGRFVISNSFLYLMEYMSRRARLTLNRDYANHFLIMGLSSMAYSETFINEIELLPRDVVVRIDISSRTLSTERINYGENTVRLNSAEGMKILDEWFAKWMGIIRNLYERTPNIMADLSGGFDSRMAFTLLVNSVIDLSRICVNCSRGNAHTLEEDYAIASEIAGHFGFSLNNTENFTGGELNYSVDDSVSMASFTRMFRHSYFYYTQRNRFHYNRQKFEDKQFRITGYDGETVRAYLHPADSSFISNNTNGARQFSANLKEELSDSTERILKHLLEEISHKTNIPLNSDDLAPHVYRYTRGRSHFGVVKTMASLSNTYILSPLSDAGLSRLNLNDEDCPDQNLLMAMIFTRFCPDLLKFRFTNNESISPETLKFAEKICAEFSLTQPENKSCNFSLITRDAEVSKLLSSNNPLSDEKAPSEYLRRVFNSKALRKLFATCFDEEIYLYADEYFKKTIYRPLSKCFTVIAAAEVIKHIIISEGTQERSITDDFREFAENGRASQYDILTGKFIRTCRFTKKATRWIITFPFRAVRKIIRIIRRK